MYGAAFMLAHSQFFWFNTASFQDLLPSDPRSLKRELQWITRAGFHVL